MNAQFDVLSWHRVSFHLINTRVSPAMRSHVLSVVQAIVKDVSAQVDIHPDRQPVFFHITGMRHTLKLRQGMVLPVEVMFPGATADLVQRWSGTLQAYLEREDTGRNFALAGVPRIEQRCYEALCSELRFDKNEGEICLDFLTPVPFHAPRGRRRTVIEREAFIGLFVSRLTRLFAKKFEFDTKAARFDVLPYYWHYTEIKHDSVSQEGHTQYINGCAGKLYIKGEFGQFLPYLILGSELHAGGRLGNAQGYFVMHKDSLPYFSAFFPRAETLEPIIDDVMQRYDHAAESIAAAEGFEFNRKDLARTLAQRLADGTYMPSPHKAFLLQKKNGGERLIEQPALYDLIVQEYLLRTFADVAERIFEEQSIGYRKGVSRMRAAEMIQQAIQEGFRYVIESDIEDFFPSVELQTLRQLLERYIPEKDHLLVNCIMKSVCAGYVLNGSLHERARGLAQGSPLSPLLANLYLDAFDEAIARYDVRLVRYADDFVILTRTREQAERILSASASVLSEIGLRLNRDKTAIRSIQEGFDFLGMRFAAHEVMVKPEEELHLLKKPVYVTEPFLFLGVNGEALELRRGGSILETIPFRRVSEIMVMERATFSTAVVRKCLEYDIPLTITLQSGYFIATIRPDSKRYFDIGYEHARVFYALSDSARLAIAKDLAATKLENYMSLFKQRYEPSVHSLLKELEHYVSRIHEAATVDTIRGFEAAAARAVYRKLNTVIEDQAFHISKRDRKTPDRINSLLNFASYLLFARINATVRAAGLNPYLGFLHSPDNSYESLVSDIVEVFRARVDRVVVRMLNLKVITPKDFVVREQGYYLTHEASKTFLNHYEGELDRKASPDTMSVKDAIYAQVQVIKKWITENRSLSFYRWEV